MKRRKRKFVSETVSEQDWLRARRAGIMLKALADNGGRLPTERLTLGNAVTQAQ